MAQSFMTTATTPAPLGSSGFLCSMVAMTEGNNGLGRGFCMSALVDTLAPKISLGASPVGKMAAGAWKCLTAWIARKRALLPFIVRSPWPVRSTWPVRSPIDCPFADDYERRDLVYRPRFWGVNVVSRQPPGGAVGRSMGRNRWAESIMGIDHAAFICRQR